jgi:hypothetical protein
VGSISLLPTLFHKVPATFDLMVNQATYASWLAFLIQFEPSELGKFSICEGTKAGDV